MADNSAIKVFLLDDHEIVRRGLRDLLEAEDDLVVIGESGSAREAERIIPALRPQVAVLDARLPDGSGIDVCRTIRSRDPSIHALILTSYDDDQALFAAIMAGAAGYVLKQVRGNELVQAIRTVAGGQSLLDPAVTAKVLERLRSGTAEPEEFADLTEREKEILRLIAEGLTNRPDRPTTIHRREDGEELRLQPARQARPRAPDSGGGPGREAHSLRWRPALTARRSARAGGGDGLPWDVRPGGRGRFALSPGECLSNTGRTKWEGRDDRAGGLLAGHVRWRWRPDS
jgi:two-component system response regulator DevR